MKELTIEQKARAYRYESKKEMKAIVKDALNCIGNVQDFMPTQIQSAMSRKQSHILMPILLNLKET